MAFFTVCPKKERERENLGGKNMYRSPLQGNRETSTSEINLQCLLLDCGMKPTHGESYRATLNFKLFLEIMDDVSTRLKRKITIQIVTCAKFQRWHECIVQMIFTYTSMTCYFQVLSLIKQEWNLFCICIVLSWVFGGKRICNPLHVALYNHNILDLTPKNKPVVCLVDTSQRCCY